MTTAWSQPPAGLYTATGCSVCAYGSGLLVPDAIYPQVWPFPSLTAGPGSAAINIPGAVGGFIACEPDGSGGAYVLGQQGNIYQITSSGAVVDTTALNGIFVGMAPSGGSQIAVRQDGHTFNLAGTAGSVFAGSPVYGAAPYGANGVATLCLGSGQIGLLPSLNGTITYSAIPSGAATPTCIGGVGSGGTVVVGGWSPAVLTIAAVAVATNPAISTVAAALLGSSVQLLTATSTYADNWAPSGSPLTGLSAAALFATWTIAGTQLLVTDPTNGKLQVLSYSLGVFTLAQTLTLSGAREVALTPDGTQGLVATPSGPVIITQSSGTWSIGSAVGGAAAANCVVSLGATKMAIGTSAGVSILTYAGSTWSVTSSMALSFAVVQIVTDATGAIYAAGSGSAVVIPGTVASNVATWSGNCAGLLAFNSQLLVADGTSGLIRVFGQSSGYTFAQQSTYALSGVAALNMAGKTIFASNTGNTKLLSLGAPWTVKAVPSGAVCTYTVSGGGWATATLGIDHVPSGIGVEPSGVAHVVTIQNDIYTLSAAGAITATSTVPQPPAQVGTPPMGCSGVYAPGDGTVRVTTVMTGQLIQVA